jgi:hypothetical protein
VALLRRNPRISRYFGALRRRAHLLAMQRARRRSKVRLTSV